LRPSVVRCIYDLVADTMIVTGSQRYFRRFQVRL